MASIDKKIVEMQLDNKNFESNAKSTINTVDKLKNSMDFDKAGQSLANVGKAASGIDMESLNSATQTVSDRLSTMGIIGVTALVNITNKAIDAGAQLVKSITIDPIKQGWEEYELKMGSIQTIMASTGAPLEMVNEKLEELNLYADKTIYSFSDMTSNIGKFTNAGVDLDKAVAAIQGVSNVAAVSGANANEASRAMYNFAQALSAGHVKLIDWKSIENANMATVEFKTQLMESAVAAGTLEKSADGMYRVLSTNSKGGTMDQTIDATHNFNESLEYQWMTTDALIGTLGDYADETTAIGKKAFAAAQDVKTFTQLIDTLQEAVGSGWGQTFELIIGDFEEAKELFTDLSNYFGGFIERSAEARNSALQGWKDLGGRQTLDQSLWNSLYAIEKLLGSIGRAFHDLFPKKTGEDLLRMTDAFWQFTDNVYEFTVEMDGPIYNTFKGLFTILKVITTTIGSVVGMFFKLLGALTPVLKGILNVTGAFGEFISSGGETLSLIDVIRIAFEYLYKAVHQVATWIGDAFTGLGRVINKWTSFIKKDTGDLADGISEDSDTIVKKVNPIGAAFEGIKQVVSNVVSSIRPAISKLKDIVVTAFSKIKEVVGGLFSGMDTNDAANILNVGVLTSIAVGIGNFFKNLSGPVEGLSGMLEGLTGILDGVRTSFETWQTKLKAKTLMSLAVAIGILAVSLVTLAGIDGPKLAVALAGVTGGLTVLIGALTVLTKLSSSGKIAKMNGVATSLILLATAITIMAKALRIMGQLSWKEIVKGLGALTVVLTELVVASRLLEKNSKGMIKSAASLVIFAVAIRTLGKAIGTLGALNANVLAKGFIALTILITELVIASKLLGSDKSSIAGALNLVTLATAVNILAVAVSKLGVMSWKQIVKGVGAVAGTMGALVAAVNLLPRDTLLRTAGLIGLTAALAALAGVMSIYSRMSMVQIAKGLGTLTGSIVALLIGLNFAKGSAGAAASLILVATAVNMLVPAIFLMGSMPIGKLVKGLGSLATIFGVLGLAAKLLMPLTPAMLALAGTIAIFGAGVFALGSGIALLGVGITALGASIGVLGGLITVSLTALAGVFPVVVAGIIKSISVFITSFIDMFASIITTVAKTFTNVLTTITTYAPQIITGIIEMLSAIFISIAENLPKMLDAGGQLILAFLTGVVKNLPGIVKTGLEVVITFLNAVISKLPDIMLVGVNLVVAFLQGIATGMPRLVENGVALVVAFVKSLTSQLPLLVTTAVDFIVTFAETLVSEMPRIVGAGVDIVLAFIEAIVAQLPKIIDTAFKVIIDFINGLADAIRNNTGALLAAGVNLITAIVQGIVNGVIMMTQTVVKNGSQIVSSVIGAITSGLNWAWNKGWELIKNVVGGIISSVSNSVSAVWNGGKRIVSNVVDSIASGVNDLWNSGWSVAKNVVDGLLVGIQDMGGAIWEGAKSIGSGIVNGITGFLGINSPSKVTTELGKWTGQGMVDGLLSMAKAVHDGGKQLGEQVLDPITEAMSMVVDAIEDDPDFSPTITPVIDSSLMDKGIKGINSALSKVQTSIGTTVGSVSTIHGISKPGDDSTKQNSQNGSDSEGKTILFTQNNYSPKALSESEIYRNTKNQFARLKEGLV